MMQRSIELIDRILRPLDRVAKVGLFALVFAAVVLVLDRRPPMMLIEVKPTAARPGEPVLLRAEVHRDGRACDAEFSRYLFDANRVSYPLESGKVSAELIARLEARTPGMLNLRVEIPPDAAPGPATVETEIIYYCNKMHRLWPLHVSTVLPFTILPP